MRAPIFAFIAALGIGAVVGVPAQAAPIAPTLGSESNPGIIEVWGGCGWGFHPNPWGYCVPNGYGYYRPYWRYRPYWGGYAYGGGYYPYWRHRPWYGY